MNATLSKDLISNRIAQSLALFPLLATQMDLEGRIL